MRKIHGGAKLAIQVRPSRAGGTQLLIGIYERSGFARVEEAESKRPGKTVSRAMGWGAGRGLARSGQIESDKNAGHRRTTR